MTSPVCLPRRRSTIKDGTLTLREANGKVYPPALHAGILSGGRSSQSFRTEQVFASLDPPPLGNWTARMLITALAQSGLPVAAEHSGSVALHGITVSVTSVATDTKRTAIELTGGARGRALRDDRGQSCAELPSPGRTFPNDAEGRYVADALFPRCRPTYAGRC